MTSEEIFIEVSDVVGWGQNISQKRSTLERKLSVVLAEMDDLVSWRCAIVDFSKTVPINKNRVVVSSINLFKPIICKFVDSDGVEKPLTHREMTNFEIQDARFGTGTNESPTIYTTGGGYIYVGPGIMAVATTISGKVQRRLTPTDINQLPASMIIDGMVKRTITARTIADPTIRTDARISWLTNKKAIIAAALKRTSEERDTQPLDPVIARNIRYMADYL